MFKRHSWPNTGHVNGTHTLEQQVAQDIFTRQRTLIYRIDDDETYYLIVRQIALQNQGESSVLVQTIVRCL